jgi:hypothetical protein
MIGQKGCLVQEVGLRTFGWKGVRELWYNWARVIIPGSSAVERSPVKRLVAGSNPARGARFVLT